MTGYKLRPLHIVITLIFVVLLMAMFSSIMTQKMDHNEHVHISAGVLIQNSALYKDFGYINMPYLPIIYGLIYRLTGTTYYLLVGRLLAFSFMSISLLLMFLVTYRISKDLLISTSFALLFVFHYIVIGRM